MHGDAVEQVPDDWTNASREESRCPLCVRAVPIRPNLLGQFVARGCSRYFEAPRCFASLFWLRLPASENQLRFGTFAPQLINQQCMSDFGAATRNRTNS